MKNLFESVNLTVRHLAALHDVFVNESSYRDEEKPDYELYKKNNEALTQILSDLELHKQLYGSKGRQMILADLLEYIFLGRGYYALQSKTDRQNFVTAIIRFVNLLMCYDTITVSDNLRKAFITELATKIPGVADEAQYVELKDFSGTVGLKKGESDAPLSLDKYFDTLLPKTAGGLWHELLVYVFILRHNLGYIVPLLLHQRLLSRDSNIVPPDFLLITHDRQIFGIEVGTKKEVQSGSFSLQTAIPTATIDTINSRVSDRCPICKKWIPFCDYVISRYSNFDNIVDKDEVRCLEECDLYSREDIASGACPYTKYSRKRAQTLAHAQHDFANGLHYHYKCVLSNVVENVKNAIIAANDIVALKTHYPYYTGLEELIKNKQ